jgi:hypothetical protein
MNKASVALIALNLAVLPAWMMVLKDDQVSVKTEVQESTQRVSESASEKTTSKKFKPTTKQKADRQQRLSANFFLPILGERNSLSDMVDGMITKNLPNRLRINKSFDELLKELYPDISDEERKERKSRFKEIMGDYVKELYNIQRGTSTDGDQATAQIHMKQRLAKELQLSDAELQLIDDKERERKTKEQLSVFEGLLIRDQDKLSEDQKASLNGLLLGEQVTLFDEGIGLNEAMDKSDRTLESAEEVLNSDQLEHFRNFQEFHWHSYDMPEMNDMPGMF